MVTFPDEEGHFLSQSHLTKKYPECQSRGHRFFTLSEILFGTVDNAAKVAYLTMPFSIPMIERIKYLEALARAGLEPDTAVRSDVRSHVIRYSEEFLEHIYNSPAFVADDGQSQGISMSLLNEHPADIAPLLDLLRRHVDGPGLNPASGGHLGYIPGGGIYYSALGDYLADIMNRYAGIHYAGPGAVKMERLLLDWMSDIIGYPRESGGNLTSGGSIANLIGIVTARDNSGMKASDFHRSVIYLTTQAHHSVDKAIRIAGLSECVLRFVPLDVHFRMDAGKLDQTVAEDSASGLNPWLVIGSAGTTDVGAVDPLDAIADIAERHSLWFHLDAAYGGFFVLCEDGKRILKGMDRSDSIVMDPHKGLFLPYGTGAVLVKNTSALFQSFRYQANYLQDAVRAGEELSPADLSPELTKHFRGLRFWLPLKLAGVAPFRAALEEKLLLARYFHQRISEVDGFVAGPPPELSVATFRYLPRKGDPNLFNERLIKEVQRDGRVFISSTMLNGIFTLRVAILSFRTHMATIDQCLEVLASKARSIETET